MLILRLAALLDCLLEMRFLVKSLEYQIMYSANRGIFISMPVAIILFLSIALAKHLRIISSTLE